MSQLNETNYLEMLLCIKYYPNIMDYYNFLLYA